MEVYMKKEKNFVKKLLAGFCAASLLFGALSCSSGSDDEGSTDTPENTDDNQEKNQPENPQTPGVPTIAGDFYPAADSTNAFVDTDLYVVYDTDIEIDREAIAKITISDGTNTDEIAVADETYKVDGCNKTTADVKVNKELVLASGKTLVIKPHSILTAGTKYTVTVPAGIVKNQEAKSWSFTPKAISAPENKVITVGTDCASINGALKLIGSDEANWTINVPAGSYHEILGYYGSANLTLVGADAEYGTSTKVYWNNSQALGNSQRTRQSFIWEGGNLTIKNMSFQNTANRAEEGNVNIQAETLYFDCKKDLVVYNSSFSSYQDTLLLGNNGGRAWFYKCYIAGDVDFIWGYADVALFEDCKIVCLADGIKNDAKIFASRTVSADAKTGKGFVLLNSDVTIQDGCKAGYGRSSGADTQAAVINCTFTTEGNGSLISALWESASDTKAYEPNGEMAVGYKDYGNTLNGSAVDTSSRKDGTAAMTERLVNREYNGRYTILNRYYNKTDSVYAANDSDWDISSYETDFGAAAEDSNTNIYVDPVYTENVVGGNTVQLTPSSKVDGLTYTYASSDESIATVDANGLVTTVSGKEGSATITVTASNNKKDTAVVGVIASVVKATGVSVTADSDSMARYAVQNLTITVSPEDATDKSVTLTTSDANLKFYDAANKIFVTELTTSDSTVQIWASAEVSGATITAKSAAAASATEGTVTVSTAAGVTSYTAAEAWARGGNANGTINFQKEASGTWEDMLVVSGAAIGTSNSKFQVSSAERIQARNTKLYIPVTGASTIEIALTGAFESSDSSYFAIGDATTSSFTASEDMQTFTYTYAGDSTGTVTGSELSGTLTLGTSKGTKGSIDTSATYLIVHIAGTTDRYISAITVRRN